MSHMQIVESLTHNDLFVRLADAIEQHPYYRLRQFFSTTASKPIYAAVCDTRNSEMKLISISRQDALIDWAETIPT